MISDDPETFTWKRPTMRMKSGAIIFGSLLGTVIALIGKLESVEQVWQIVGLAFTAFFVWLGIRIFNRRERWAICLAAAVGLVFYEHALITYFGQPPPPRPLVYAEPDGHDLSSHLEDIPPSSYRAATLSE